MGFMSLVFMGIYLIIMAAGALNILIAAIIFLVRFIKKKKNKRVSSISKVFAILLLSLGILAELPMVIAGIQMSVEEAREKQEYENLGNKVLIETDGLQDEFEYEGETLVKVGELDNSSVIGYDELKSGFVANLVFINSDETHEYAEMRKTANNSGYAIYIVHDIFYYVKKEDKEKVIDYYNTKTEYIVKVYISGDWVDCEIDATDVQRIRDIVANSETNGKEKRPGFESDRRYRLEINSVDYIWGDAYPFYLCDDCVLLYPETEDDDSLSDDEKEIETEGYLLSKEDEAYIRDIFEKAITDAES